MVQATRNAAQHCIYIVRKISVNRGTER